MPKKLHDSTAVSIVQVGVNNPLPYLDVILAWSLEHLLSRYCKLCTAYHCNLVRNLEEPLITRYLNICPVSRWCAGAFEDIREYLRRHMGVVVLILLASWV